MQKSGICNSAIYRRGSYFRRPGTGQGGQSPPGKGILGQGGLGAEWERPCIITFRGTPKLSPAPLAYKIPPRAPWSPPTPWSSFWPFGIPSHPYRINFVNLVPQICRPVPKNPHSGDWPPPDAGFCRGDKSAFFGARNRKMVVLVV